MINKSHTRSRAKARFNWDRLKVSFWFAPVVMSVGAILLAWSMNWLDARIPNIILQDSRLVLAGSTSELRSLLVSLAATVLATAGVVFSLLTLPLSTVAAQYGSRLLRVFLADRITQFVLGMFVGTFVYCIAAAASIPRADLELEAPQVAVTVAMLLMFATFASLITLIQHISTMLQAPNIIAAAGAELLEVLRQEDMDEGAAGNDHSQASQRLPDSRSIGSPGVGQDAEAVKKTLIEAQAYPVRAKQAGYIQYVDLEYLLTLAREKDLVIHLLRRPGQFVQHGLAAARVWPAGRVDEQLDRHLRHAFQLGRQRTPVQDVEYAVNQLVEIALRTMSPAINDPFTALTCLDHLGDGLAQFVQQDEPSPYYYDPQGRLRLIMEPVTFGELLGAAFDMLRHCSCDNAQVLLKMLQVIHIIGEQAKSAEARQELLRHVRLIQAESQKGALIEPDRQLIQQQSEVLHRKWSATP